MPLTLDENPATYKIRAYQPGFIQVNETIYTNSLLISPTHLISDWPPQTLAELTAEHFKKIIALQPAILLLGTGTTLRFPPLEVYGHLLNQGIGVEIMDTSAACRTYNALTAEARHVVAALIVR